MPNGIQAAPAQAQPENVRAAGFNLNSLKPSAGAVVAASSIVSLASLGMMGKAAVNLSSFALSGDQGALSEGLILAGASVCGVAMSVCAVNCVNEPIRHAAQENQEEELESSDVQEAQAWIVENQLEGSSISSGTALAQEVGHVHQFEMVVLGQDGQERTQLDLESLDSLSTNHEELPVAQVQSVYSNGTNIRSLPRPASLSREMSC